MARDFTLSKRVSLNQRKLSELPLKGSNAAQAMERGRSRKRNIFFEGGGQSKLQKLHFGSGSTGSLGFLPPLDVQRTEKTEPNEEINFIRKAGRIIEGGQQNES